MNPNSMSPGIVSATLSNTEIESPTVINHLLTIHQHSISFPAQEVSKKCSGCDFTWRKSDIQRRESSLFPWQTPLQYKRGKFSWSQPLFIIFFMGQVGRFVKTAEKVVSERHPMSLWQVHWQTANCVGKWHLPWWVSYGKDSCFQLWTQNLLSATRLVDAELICKIQVTHGSEYCNDITINVSAIGKYMKDQIIN